MPEPATRNWCTVRTGRRLWPVLALAVWMMLSAAPSERHATADAPPDAARQGVPDLGAIERAFEDVIARVSPSVVGIRAQRRHFSAITDAGPTDENYELHEQRVVVNGSGTIITDSGLILTNEHVVQSAAQIDILFYDGQKLPATVLASDPRADLAVLQVDRHDLPPATFCDWSRVVRGQWAIALGNPFGLGRDGHMSASTGVVSNLGRQLPGLGEVDDRFYSNMIQTTAAINPGNSGGPLFNIRGELIGVVTAMHTRAPADEGVGFALPMTPAKRAVIDTLCQGRRVEYGYIGLTVRLPDDEEHALYAAAGYEGVIVSRVEPDGPAAQVDVRVGDLILTYDGQTAQGPAQMAELVGHTPVGNQVAIELVRGGRPKTVSVAVDVRDISRVSWMRGEAVLWRGMRLTNLTDDARRLMRLDGTARGVVVIDVSSPSPASDAGIEVGDVIDGIDGRGVDDTSDLLLRVRSSKGSVMVSVRDRGTHLVLP